MIASSKVHFTTRSRARRSLAMVLRWRHTRARKRVLDWKS
jgi:hypothetical protein